MAGYLHGLARRTLQPSPRLRLAPLREPLWTAEEPAWTAEEPAWAAGASEEPSAEIAGADLTADSPPRGARQQGGVREVPAADATPQAANAPEPIGAAEPIAAPMTGRPVHAARPTPAVHRPAGVEGMSGPIAPDRPRATGHRRQPVSTPVPPAAGVVLPPHPVAAPGSHGAPVQSRIAREPATAQPVMSAAPRSAPLPDVHIHIGRIELTAVNTPAPRREPAPVKTPMSLEVYLERRKGGAR